jgi:hypothetical protein
MAKRLGRQELYDLVWATPMKTLAARFQISDVGLKKACARARIPTPDRGYWAKRTAGKPTTQVVLPKRAPGMSDEVIVGGGNSHWWYDSSQEDLQGPLHSPPEFHEPLDTVRERIAAAVGKVTVPQKVTNWHPLMDELLKEDEQRREQQRVSPYHATWNAPRFDSSIERRRLRILNGLFFAVAKMDGRPYISTREALSIHVAFFQQHVGITLEYAAQSRNRKQQTTEEPPLSLSIRRTANPSETEATWRDNDESKLEAQMTEITIEVILTAERHYRGSEFRHYEWRVKRKAELEEQERQRKIAAEKAAKERQQRIEQAKIDRLLKDAAALQQANVIRQYVAALRTLEASTSLTSAEEFDRWSKWALAQADRIDPAIGGSFITVMHNDEGTGPT